MWATLKIVANIVNFILALFRQKTEAQFFDKHVFKFQNLQNNTKQKHIFQN